MSCGRIASAATAICRRLRPKRALLLRMHVLPRLRRGHAWRRAPIAAANWCGGRSGRPIGYCVTRPDPAGVKPAGCAPAGVPVPRCRAALPPRAGPAVHRDGHAARRQRARGGGPFGHPSRSRPARHAGAAGGARGGARRRWRRIASAIPTRSASRRCARRSPGITASNTASRSIPARSSSPPVRRRRFSCLSRRVRARRPGRAGGARLSGLSQHPLRARPRTGADRGRRERALPAQPRIARRKAGDIAGLIVASPANPTGTMIPPGAGAACDFCRERGIRLVSDEIYHGITYETAPQTARAFGKEIVVINSFSKYYSMTGWRLGWMVVPPDLARSVECLAQNFYISPPALSQLAALAAFGCRAELDGACRALPRQSRPADRDAREAGLSRFAPAEGAFYLYVDVSVDPRQRGILPAHAGRDRRRDDAGPRFRPAPRRRLASPVVRRLDRGHRRSRAAAQGVAPAGLG